MSTVRTNSHCDGGGARRPCKAQPLTNPASYKSLSAHCTALASRRRHPNQRAEGWLKCSCSSIFRPARPSNNINLQNGWIVPTLGGPASRNIVHRLLTGFLEPGPNHQARSASGLGLAAGELELRLPTWCNCREIGIGAEAAGARCPVSWPTVRTRKTRYR